MKKPKILFISYTFYPNVGGIEINAQVLTSEFHRLGYPIKVITMVQDEGEKTFPFPVVRNPGLQELFRLHKWADVVFENNPSLRLSWPQFLMSSKSVIAIRGRISREDGTVVLQDRLKRMALNAADGVIAVSRATRDSFFPKATVIGNPYRNDIFRDLGFERAPLSFVYLGRLVSEKGVHIALEALSQLNTHLLSGQPKSTFTIIGDGPEMQHLKNMVEQKGLVGQVFFEGKKVGAEVVEILNRSRYLLVPSLDEAFGNVALEGMACGCLPIASDCRGLPDAVGNAGILFKTYSSEALTRVILELINNPKLEAQYRSNIKSHLEQHLPHRVAQKYLEVIVKAYQKK